MQFASFRKKSRAMFKSFAIPALLLTAVLAGCADRPWGERVQEPFSGKAYESNARFFRATGKATSKQDGIARSKAELLARQSIAQQVNTTIQVVSDNYGKDVETEHLTEAMSRFETLVREITNTTIADVRKVGEEKYLNSEGVYTVFVALEVRKAAMYRHLKKQARLETELSEAARKELERMLDAEIEKAEAAERDGTD
jgi:hypothetical protein